MVQVNHKTLDALISIIESSNPNLCIMLEYHKETNCGTAHCVGGWLETLQENNPSLPPLFANLRGLRGLEEIDAESELFFLPERVHLHRFDNYPAEKRKAAMLSVLRTLKQTGEVDWHKALHDNHMDCS